jgi:preprotein translocase subunit SecD
MNRFPLWKNLLVLVIAIAGAVMALPNLYGKDPALQISSSTAEISDLTRLKVETALDEAGLEAASYELGATSLVVRFADEVAQLKAQDVAERALGRAYTVALNLAPATPAWLRRLGLEPMFLGLDLRGGVHFLMEVDMDAAVRQAEERYVSDIRTLLRENKLRYRTIGRQPDGGVSVRFRSAGDRDAGMTLMRDTCPELVLSTGEDAAGAFEARAVMSETAVTETRRFALQQNITTLRKRVNELGVAEPVIQQQGLNRVVVQLPGVQDTARAKEIIGATATLEFRMVDEQHAVQDAFDGRVPAGSRLYYDRANQPVLLKKQVMLTGEYIIDAASGIDPTSGGPDVSITLDGKGANIFSRATRNEVGKRMAVVYIETKTDTVEEGGVMVKKKEVVEEVINVAVIREQLGKRFHITGLDSPQEARNLALLLRAGALAAPIEIVEERTVGPSLGRENIEKGSFSALVGSVLVFLFMVVYYRVFGLVANIALVVNVMLVVALLSLLQATLTLPGIAGIALTVGMAVDANVLIYERIREELRNGNSPHASIHAGYERAFVTIMDSNLTTLISALFLFAIGTGPIKGFAVTLSLGILCSMFSAITVTRAIVNFIFGGRRLARLPI